MPVHVRPGTSSDFADVQRLNQALFDYEQALGYYQDSFNVDWPASEAGVSYFTKLLDHSTEPSRAFIAELSGETVGYLAGAIYHPAYRSVPVATIENMFVAETARGQGVGSMLINAFGLWAKSRGAERLRVEVFTSVPNPARAFYEANGLRGFESILERPV